MSIYRPLDKEELVKIYSGILLSHKKEWNMTIGDSRDGLREYYAKWNKPEKDKYHEISLICGGIWKNNIKEPMKHTIHWYREQTDAC